MYINSKGIVQHRDACPSLLLLLASLSIYQVNGLKAETDPGTAIELPLRNLDNVAGSNISGAVDGDGGSDFEQLVEAKLNETTLRTINTQELLSRKRRYLVFPEGSSFQLVYDEIICVVDYTSYMILGITVALAWELPSKPPSEALDDLLNKLEDGTIDVSRNDTVSNITYHLDKTPKQTQQTPPAGNNLSNNNYKSNYISLFNKGAQNGDYSSYYKNSLLFRAPMHPSYKYAGEYYRRPTATGRRKDNHYYYNSSGSNWRNPFERYKQPFSPAQKTRYPYWALDSHLKDKWGKQRKSFHRNTSKKTFTPNMKPIRHHQIYPVYGKRSLPDAANPHHRHRRSGVSSVPDSKLTKLESIQIKYHRNSRQNFYKSIEKYLDKRGHNGHQCVLRTLCETGKKSTEQVPGSFVGELLRAVFTIPEALDHEPLTNGVSTNYDKAHSHEGDCSTLYPECKQSIWEAPFVQ